METAMETDGDGSGAFPRPGRVPEQRLLSPEIRRWPPLYLLFGSLEASVNFWTFGFCFVQFREYFLCSFSKTQKQ
jgi:hypothetical protein